jgi:hypothetical protein
MNYLIIDGSSAHILSFHYVSARKIRRFINTSKNWITVSSKMQITISTKTGSKVYSVFTRKMDIGVRRSNMSLRQFGGKVAKEAE